MSEYVRPPKSDLTSMIAACQDKTRLGCGPLATMKTTVPSLSTCLDSVHRLSLQFIHLNKCFIHIKIKEDSERIYPGIIECKAGIHSKKTPTYLRSSRLTEDKSK